jgi:hypothetical protein
MSRSSGDSYGSADYNYQITDLLRCHTGIVAHAFQEQTLLTESGRGREPAPTAHQQEKA